MHVNRKEFLTLAGLGAAASVAAASVRTTLLAQGAQTAKTKKLEGRAISGATDAVRRFISSASIRDMPPEVIAQGKRCLVDGFGVILAGSTVEGSRILRTYVKATGGTAASTILGPEPLRAPATLAALANGGAGHAMDYGDTQLSSTPDRTFGLLTHPTVPALAAALAVAERRGASGSELLEAYLTGFEVECKIAEAIDPNHYERGFHSSGTIGAFGAMTAAAKLGRLNDTQLAHALAITSSLASGIRVNFGSMSKPLNVARAAENGVFAAELASRGFTGGDFGLDGQWGFFQVLGGGADIDRLVGALGRPWSIVNPGISFKPYPCGSLSHPSMDAMLKVIVDHDVKPEQVKAVRLRAGRNILDPLRYGVAKTELEAKFSVPFLMSAIILRRRAGIREFTDAFVASAPVQEMMRKVTAVHDEAIEKQGFDKIRSTAEVDLADGRTLVQAADERYRGGPANPFSTRDLHGKFADCASMVLSDSQAAGALAAIEGIDALPDVRQLVSALAPSRG